MTNPCHREDQLLYKLKQCLGNSNIKSYPNRNIGATSIINRSVNYTPVKLNETYENNSHTKKYITTQSKQNNSFVSFGKNQAANISKRISNPLIDTNIEQWRIPLFQMNDKNNLQKDNQHLNKQEKTKKQYIQYKKQSNYDQQQKDYNNQNKPIRMNQQKAYDYQNNFDAFQSDELIQNQQDKQDEIRYPIQIFKRAESHYYPQPQKITSNTNYTNNATPKRNDNNNINQYYQNIKNKYNQKQIPQSKSPFKQNQISQQIRNVSKDRQHGKILQNRNVIQDFRGRREKCYQYLNRSQRKQANYNQTYGLQKPNQKVNRIFNQSIKNGLSQLGKQEAILQRNQYYRHTIQNPTVLINSITKNRTPKSIERKINLNPDETPKRIQVIKQRNLSLYETPSWNISQTLQEIVSNEDDGTLEKLKKIGQLNTRINQRIKNIISTFQCNTESNK